MISHAAREGSVVFFVRAGLSRGGTQLPAAVRQGAKRGSGKLCSS